MRISDWSSDVCSSDLRRHVQSCRRQSRRENRRTGKVRSSSMSSARVFTRRRLLTNAAQVASVAAAATLMPSNVQKLMAQAPRRAGTLKDIRHVVLLMQENRSFDHYFGMLSGVRGFGDSDPQMLSTGKNVFHQPDPANRDGYLLPFHLDTFSTTAQTLPSTSHEWTVQHQAWNRSEEHTSELQSLMRISYAVFC